MQISSSSTHTLRTVLIFLAALSVAMIVLNRWAVTELGVQSFGRVWHFYASYADFGFMRRGLLGTVLSQSGLNGLVSNEYVFAHIVQATGIVVLVLLAASYCIRRNLTDPLFIVGVACSPAFIIHSGYSTGSLDLFILILALLNTLYVRSIGLFSAIIIAGVLTHEMFIFLLPAQVLALCLNHEADARSTKRDVLIAALSAAAATAVVFLFGRVSMPEPQYLEIMRDRLPNASGQHTLWSGYYEVGSSVERNLHVIGDLTAAIKSGAILFLAPALVYLGLLMMRTRRYLRNRVETVLLIFAVIAPVFASLVANDFHRWPAMSANMALILTLRLVAREGDETSKWNLPIAFYCLLAPFGGAQLERPFPMHQFLLERFLS